MTSRTIRFEEIGPFAAGALLLFVLLGVWAARLSYPYDLEWMEGGMLAHAWRLDQGLQIYVRPNLDFVPYVYPPGYSAVVALFGKVFGLSMPLGRLVSVVCILASAAIMGWSLRQDQAPRAIVWAIPIMFLGTYPMVGAFYDLVRPDSMAVALLGASLALSLDTERRWAPVASGLLLAAAFLTKQNTAVLGAPMLLALLQRDRRAGLWFAASSIGPALLSIGVLQWWSSGNFLVWMLEVPRSHVALWSRLGHEVPIEWGTALPLAFAVVAVAWVWDAIRHQRLIPGPVAVAVPVWAGMAAIAWGLREINPSFAPGMAAFAFWGAVAGPLALVVLALGTLVQAAQDAASGETIRAWLPPWWWTWEVGTVTVAGGSALLMRVHDSGFINVHAPFFWVLALVAGRVLGRWAAQAGPVRWSPAINAAVTGQLVWGLLNIDGTALVPTEEDVKAGDRFVAEVAKAEGPVLSPFAAWLPTYAGKPPSLHAMGVWDCNYPGGPYFEDLALINQAIETQHWPMILGAQQPMLGEFVRFYEPSKEVVAERETALNPKTGYIVRPWRLLVPRAGE